MILRAGTFTLAAAGADYCNSVQYLVNSGSVQGARFLGVALHDKAKKDARLAARPILLTRRTRNYQLALSVYLPLVEPVPPL
jgi:hypothetical protein